MTYPAIYLDAYDTMTQPIPSGLPVLPQIIVEAGLVSNAPRQASLSLVLDDPVNGLLDTGQLGTAITWTGISPDVKGFTVTRPSTREQGPLWNYQAATVSILLDNSSGNYDPDNLAGPYVDGSGNTQLTAMVPVRVRAAFGSFTYPVYSGFSDGWIPAEITYAGGYAEMTLPGTDAFKVLAGINLPAVSIEGVGADTGSRVRDILTRAGWYTSAEYSDIDTGNSKLQGTTLGADALSLMQIAVDSEIGQLYVNGSGAVVFRARQAFQNDTRSNVVQAVFGDLPGTSHPAGTELAIASVGRATDDTVLVNDVQAAINGGTTQEATNAASVSKYLFPRTYSRTDLILQTDTDALNWAKWVLYIGTGTGDRVDSIQIDPLADPNNLWPQVLGREIGDRIQVWCRPAGVAAPVSKDCFIAGIVHVWDSPSSAWLTTWTLQDAAQYGSFLTLDNPTLGKLDANALTF